MFEDVKYLAEDWIQRQPYFNPNAHSMINKVAEATGIIHELLTKIAQLEACLKLHKHTDECLAYAAKTGKAFCIVECRDARRKAIGGERMKLSERFYEILGFRLEDGEERSYSLQDEVAQLEAVLDALGGHDADMLLAKAKQLKQTDGEGWAIGELVERAVVALGGE